jgi:hypothetical protein
MLVVTCCALRNGGAGRTVVSQQEWPEPDMPSHWPAMCSQHSRSAGVRSATEAKQAMAGVPTRMATSKSAAHVPHHRIDGVYARKDDAAILPSVCETGR